MPKARSHWEREHCEPAAGAGDDGQPREIESWCGFDLGQCIEADQWLLRSVDGQQVALLRGHRWLGGRLKVGGKSLVLQRLIGTHAEYELWALAQPTTSATGHSRGTGHRP